MKPSRFDHLVPPTPDSFHSRVRTALSDAHLTERRRPARRLGALIAAVLILALALGGIAYAIAQSRILEALFPDRAPTRAAQELVRPVGERTEQGDCTLTINEAMIDGENIYVDWTLTSESGETLLISPLFQISRNGERVDAVLEMLSTDDHYVVGDTMACIGAGRSASVLSTIRLLDPIDAGIVDVDMEFHILEPLAALVRWDDWAGREASAGRPAYEVGAPNGVAFATPLDAGRYASAMGRSGQPTPPPENVWEDYYARLEEAGYARYLSALGAKLSFDAGAVGRVDIPLTGQTSFAFDGYTIEFARLIATPTGTTLGYYVYFDDLPALIGHSENLPEDGIESHVYDLEAYRLQFNVRPDGGAPLEGAEHELFLSGPSFRLGFSAPSLADGLDATRDALTAEIRLPPLEPLPKTLVLDAYASGKSPLDWTWPAETGGPPHAGEDPLFTITLHCG